MPETTILAEPAMDEYGNITIKDYADTALLLPFFDENDNPRDMTGVTIKMVVEGLTPIVATDTGQTNTKLLTIPADYADGFDENKPKEYALLDMSISVNGGELFSGTIRAKKIS